MNLNLILPIKKIKCNNKEISIPKLGLKHHHLIKEVRDLSENMGILLDSIHPGLTAAESDLVCLHLLEFNGKLKSTVMKDGFTYNINDIYICQRLEFQYQGITFYFRSPDRYEVFTTVDKMLSSCFIKTNLSDEAPDFLRMPAFVSKWADDITNMIAIPGPHEPIKGTSKILGLFE
ncbi:baseplate hub distal subunit [Salmonella phage STML-198]|uniref:Baseplate hub n=2 Tax=Gelderlandvirus TaxID=1913653 RepID=K4I485_9CAUD|nr:baseplate hub distal subunit [Salmonella phage STML-198]YP_009615668.1 baseplate hub distal subunit [Salmonella phage Melville]AFU64132.1 baseplate hub [Salmonella phage STML-198]ATN93156.1 baseplate hub distal subunit [Salmonella phage Melville]UPW42302.1 baseplate hub assembly protein [Salmonella phage CF-SP2]